MESHWIEIRKVTSVWGPPARQKGRQPKSLLKTFGRVRLRSSQWGVWELHTERWGFWEAALWKPHTYIRTYYGRAMKTPYVHIMVGRPYENPIRTYYGRQALWKPRVHILCFHFERSSLCNRNETKWDVFCLLKQKQQHWKQHIERWVGSCRRR